MDLIFRDAPQQHGNLLFGANGTAAVIAATIFASLPEPSFAARVDSVLSIAIAAEVHSAATASLSIEVDPNILHPVAHSNRARWDETGTSNRKLSSVWQQPEQSNHRSQSAWQTTHSHQTDTATDWRALPALSDSRHALWQYGDIITGSGQNRWCYPTTASSLERLAWEHGQRTTNTTQEAFSYPLFQRQAFAGYWDERAFIGISHADQFAWPNLNRDTLQALYEYAINPLPGQSVLPPQPPQPEPAPRRGDANLVFKGAPTGPDLVFGAEPLPLHIPRKVYILMSDIQLIRTPDGAEIDCTDASWSTDLDSWGWRWSATLANNNALSLLKPDSNGPKEIQCTVNGYTFSGIVEGYETSRQFGASRYVVSGRSTSAWLADPYAPKTSAVVTDTLTARQICDAQLINTGWTLEWDTVDWLIPANVCSWQDLDPIGVISRIAQTIGAVVQTDRSSQTLRVISRYPTSPHHWGSSAPDAAIPIDLIKSLGSEYSRTPRYNRAIIAGASSGVLVTGTLDGTAGDLLAPQIIDSLITHVDAGTERARIEIAKGRQRESIRATTWLTPAGDNGPGLLIPGQLLAVIDPDDPFRALIDGTQINATSTKEKLTVTQTLNLERWHG